MYYKSLNIDCDITIPNKRLYYHELEHFNARIFTS